MSRGNLEPLAETRDFGYRFWIPCQAWKNINTADKAPYGQTLPIRAMPRKDRKGVRRGASRPARLLLHAESGAKISGSQAAK